MSDAKHTPPQQNTKRIGLLLGDFKKVNINALKYLILHMNKLQHTFEFEFLSVPLEDEFIKRVSRKNIVDVRDIHHDIPIFLKRYQTYLNVVLDEYQTALRALDTEYTLKSISTDYFVLISPGSFNNGLYALFKDGISIFLFGDWERKLTPPSILEYIQILVMAASIYSLSPSMRNSIHLGTRGCLFDFNSYLSEVRLKVLSGYLCQECRTALLSDGFSELINELDQFLDKRWLGKSSEPNTPAGIIANLGTDLFVTTGLKPTAWETVKATLEQEWIKQLFTLIVTVVGAILIAILIILFGLK